MANQNPAEHDGPPIPVELVAGGQIELAELPALVLRDFTYRLRPQYGPAGELGGMALDVLSKVGLPIQITLMFERSEFVNLATAGLAGMDATDAHERG